MKHHDWEKNVVAVVLAATLFVGGIWSGAYKYVDEMITAVLGEVETQQNIKKAERDRANHPDIDYAALQAKDAQGNFIPQYSAVAQDYLTNLPFKRNMVDIAGITAKTLNLRELYKDSGGIVLDNGYIVGVYPYTSTDYEIQQIVDLKAFLDERGIHLLYVNQPTKYIDDQYIQDNVGLNTYINDNADRFLSRLDENGIQYLDLRKNIQEQNLDPFSLFYRTDHHWTVEAGKMAAEAIAETLNLNYGAQMDLSLYDPEKFSYTEYEAAWLGEQGKKMGATYVGLDDFTLILPKYETSFEVSRSVDGLFYSGSFGETLVNQYFYIPENNADIYDASSWHYSYMGHTVLSESVTKNNLNPHGEKILVLGDSYAQVMVPFLALNASEVRTLVLRDYAGSLKEYIANHDIDTVVIAYASFMIGAHDDAASANYDMFDFQ